ncbi:MAG: hypothetical protein Q9160_005514 [Pyrenula sp. 1 TL-2023]
MHIIRNSELDIDLLWELPIARQRSYETASTDGQQPSSSSSDGNKVNGYSQGLPNGTLATDSFNEEYSMNGRCTDSVVQDALLRLTEEQLIFQVESNDAKAEYVVYPKPRREALVETDRVLQLELTTALGNQVESYEESQDHQDRAMQEGRRTNGIMNRPKRKADAVEEPPFEPPAKRSKATGITSSSDYETPPTAVFSHAHQASNTLASTPKNPSKGRTFLRPNQEKLAMLLRDDGIRVLAQRTLPKETSDVFAAILSQVEKIHYHDARIDAEALAAEICSQTKPLQGLHDHTTAKDSMVSGDPLTRSNNRMASSHHHNSGIDSLHSNNAGNSGSQHNSLTPGPTTHNHVDQNDRNHILDFHEEQERSEQIACHLELLAESPCHFVEKRFTGNQTQWIVPLESLTKTLRKEATLSLIKARLGSVAARLVQLLMERGKTDERVLQEVALINTKDMRQILGRLKTAGFLELQEVAREASRNPSRVMYFWFFNEERARRFLVEQSFKGMSRCLQRCQIERSKIEPILAKACRSDVRGREDMYMERHELQRLERWKQKEGRFLGELARLDSLVSVLIECSTLILDE